MLCAELLIAAWSICSSAGQYPIAAALWLAPEGNRTISAVDRARGLCRAGMVTTDWAKFYERKDNGLVADVFASEARMAKLPGSSPLCRSRCSLIVLPVVML